MKPPIEDRVRAAAPTPTTRVDVADVMHRARRRRRVDRAFVGAAGLSVVVAVLVAVSSLVGAVGTGGPIIGPDPVGASSAELVVSPVPPRWSVVEVGDARLAVPPDVAIVETWEESLPTMCTNDADDHTLLHVPGETQGVYDPGPDTACDDVGASHVVLVALPISISDDGGIGPAVEVEVNFWDATRREASSGDGYVYDVPELDLRLSVLHPETRPDLVDDVLATVTTVEGLAPGPERPSLPAPGIAAADPLPQGWQLVATATATFGVPPDVDVRALEPDEATGCTNGDFGGDVVFVRREAPAVEPDTGCFTHAPSDAVLMAGPITSGEPDGVVDDIEVNGYLARRWRTDPNGGNPVVIQISTLDLELRFSNGDLRRGFVDEILPTVADLDGYVRDPAFPQPPPPSVTPPPTFPPLGTAELEVGGARFIARANVEVRIVWSGHLICPADRRAPDVEVVYVRDVTLPAPADPVPGGCPQPGLFASTLVAEPLGLAERVEPTSVGAAVVDVNGFVGRRTEELDQVVVDVRELDLRLTFLDASLSPNFEREVLGTVTDLDSSTRPSGSTGVTVDVAPNGTASPELVASVGEVVREGDVLVHELVLSNRTDRALRVDASAIVAGSTVDRLSTATFRVTDPDCEAPSTDSTAVTCRTVGRTVELAPGEHLTRILTLTFPSGERQPGSYAFAFDVDVDGEADSFLLNYMLGDP